jgi:acetoacetyl-CoA synthetase
MGCPLLPVREGRMQARCLGVAVDAWDPRGQPVRRQPGEMVITAPMPSMPLRLWDDPADRRYRATYFEQFPGVWTHGDIVEFDDDGSCVISGRSDATLNRRGIRIGPAEIYGIVEAISEVEEAMIVGVELSSGEYFMPMFVHLADGYTLEPGLAARVEQALRTGLSPRHVPDRLIQVPAVPHTKTGKKLEVPIKRLLQGAALEKAVDLGAVDDPGLVRHYAELIDRLRQPESHNEERKEPS